MKLQMITKLDRSIYRNDRDAWAVPKEMAATRANLAYLLNWADYRRIELRGRFGNIGCGETTVNLITDTGNLIPVIDEENGEDYNWPTIINMISESGSLTRDQLSTITGYVWDGNNHQFFVPIRSEQYCTETDIETYPWGTITYRVENECRMINSDTVNPDWVMLAWYDNSGYNDGVLSKEQFDLIRENPEPFDKLVEEFIDDPNETVMALFCEKADLAQVQQILTEIEAEND